jgi:hypothetical protein
VPPTRTRSLLLWFFVVLQTMTPFIHAHAGAVQLNHADFLHLHQGAPGDAAYHALAADERGAEVAVAQGIPFRSDTLVAASDAASVPTLSLPHADPTAQPGAGLPAPPQHQRVPPDYTHPHALAPPSV